MEIVRAKTITNTRLAMISLHSGPSPSGSILMENMMNAVTMQTTANQIRNGGT